jgi:seryl-tRNA synthetase
MLNSEDEAFRLSGDDRGSWSARGRAKKAYRSMPATPDEEVPKHRSKRKTKHVHKWGEWVLLRTEQRWTWWTKPRKLTPVYHHQRTCKKCGHKETKRSAW